MRPWSAAAIVAVLLAVAATAAADATSVGAVQGHTTYAKIIITGAPGGSAPTALTGMVTCPTGNWFQELSDTLKGMPECADAGYMYAYPDWAGAPWEAHNLQVLEHRLAIDDTGRLWTTVAMRYTPDALAHAPDAPAVVEALAVQIQPAAPGPDGTPVNYHLDLDLEGLQVTPDAMTAYALGIGPAPT